MVPLQYGLPGGLELLIIVGFLLIVPVMLAFGMAYWVYNDAEGRGDDNATIWAVVVGGFTITTFFVGLLAFAVYIWQRE